MDAAHKTAGIAPFLFWPLEAGSRSSPRKKQRLLATGLEIEFGDITRPEGPRAEALRPVTWAEWIALPLRPQDNAVQSVRCPIRGPTVIVAVNYAKVPKKRPKLCARAIRERDGNRCQYTGRVLRPDEGSMGHVLPRSRGGLNVWENLVYRPNRSRLAGGG